MKLVKKMLYCCPYCMSYVYAHEQQYWCELCDKYWDKLTLEEVTNE